MAGDVRGYGADRTPQLALVACHGFPVDEQAASAPVGALCQPSAHVRRREPTGQHRRPPVRRGRDDRDARRLHAVPHERRRLARHRVGRRRSPCWRLTLTTARVLSGDRNPLMLQAKGRWAGDVARIYNRLTRRGLIKASRAMHARGATDMEEIYSTFAQPA